MSFHTVDHAPALFILSRKVSRKAPSSKVSTDRRAMVSGWNCGLPSTGSWAVTCLTSAVFPALGGPSRTVRTGFLLNQLVSCLVSRVQLKNGSTVMLL
jgi:hypothetical protein